MGLSENQRQNLLFWKRNITSGKTAQEKGGDTNNQYQGFFKKDIITESSDFLKDNKKVLKQFYAQNVKNSE